MRFAVVGGGVAGLSAAWELARGGPDTAGAEVTVYEPGHLGGKVLTTTFLGRAVDEGPDSLITRVPDGLALCRELGLEEELVAPAASRAVLFSGGKLRPLPEGLVLGAPARLLPLARSRILSPAGMARASLDAVLPRSTLEGDVSVFDLLAARLGPEVAERLVEPLLGTIHAGTTRHLSAAATAPQLLDAARNNRSLIMGLRKMSRANQARDGQARDGQARDGQGPPARSPLFVAPRRGMQALADRLAERLLAAGTTVVPLKVTALRRDGHSVVVEPAGTAYDGVVLALPAPAAFSLLAPLLEQSAPRQLAAVRFASVAVVTLGFPADAMDAPQDLSGVLVPPGSGLLMTACSFGSNKWPHWAAPGMTVLRVSVGRAGDEAWADQADELLVERLCHELETVLGRRGARDGHRLPAPTGWRVSRWPLSLPQYEVGHLERVAQARATLSREAPLVALAGASYGGVGVPSCIASGRRAGRELFQVVSVGGRAAG
jgi:protoporphyrinogen/coproporphyrinogen III oxidase